MPYGDQRPETEMRALPANLEAEQALLAAMLVNNRAYDRVASIVRAEHFAEPVHGRIFSAIGSLINRNAVANPTTLKNLFDADGALEEIGGAKYLARLAMAAVTIANVAEYARIIVDLYRRRQAVLIGTDLIDRAYDFDLDTTSADLIRDTEGALFALSSDHARGGGPVDAATSMARAIEMAENVRRNGGKLLGIPTGISDLDRILGGLVAERFYLLGGRPSMGKTTLSRAIGTHAAKWLMAQAAKASAPSKSVLEFSIEMSTEEMSQGRLASETGISLDIITRGTYNGAEADRITEAVTNIGRLPLLTDDTPRILLDELTARARRVARSKGGLGLIIADHIGLINVNREIRRQGEIAILTEIGATLKALAKELHVPVLALSQLSRAIDSREDKRPMLADLRGSGTLEQDADIVMFVYREEYYLGRIKIDRRPGESDIALQARSSDHNMRLEDSRNRCEILIPKHRMGPIGSATVRFQGSTSYIGDFDQGALPL